MHAYDSDILTILEKTIGGQTKYMSIHYSTKLSQHSYKNKENNNDH